MSKVIWVITIAIAFFTAVLVKAESLNCLKDPIAMSLLTNGPFIETSFRLHNSTESKQGWFLVDTGSTLSFLDQSLKIGESSDANPEVDAIHYFSLNEFPKFLWSDFSHFELPLQQIGIIGTNVLSQNEYGFDFEKRMIYQNSFLKSCSTRELLQNRFRPLSLKGFFSTNQDSKSRHLLEIIRPEIPNPKRLRVPNIPTISIRVGEVLAVAQIDSGFDDRFIPFSVNINSALLKLVNQNQENLVVDPQIKKYSLKTCVPGVSTSITAYRLKESLHFDLMDKDQNPVRTYKNAVFFLLDVPEEAKKCGGIGTWSIPAALIGVSFLKDFGQVILNAKTKTLWIPIQSIDK